MFGIEVSREWDGQILTHGATKLCRQHADVNRMTRSVQTVRPVRMKAQARENKPQPHPST